MAERISAALDKRIVELRGENTMLLNAIQRAQRLVAEGRYEDANQVLTDVIEKVLQL